MMRKLLRSERGFTLVELLVTIAIMGVLFGIVTLALNGLSTDTTTNTKAAELDQVQTAMDVYLAATYPDGTIAAQAVAAAIVGNQSATTFHKYIRGTTEYCYTWEADGANLTEAACP